MLAPGAPQQAAPQNALAPAFDIPAAQAMIDQLGRLPGNKAAQQRITQLQQQVVADYLRLVAAMKPVKLEVDSKEVLVQDIIGNTAGISRLPPELGFERIDWKTNKPAMHAPTMRPSRLA
jgi:hypothetical protein